MPLSIKNTAPLQIVNYIRLSIVVVVIAILMTASAAAPSAPAGLEGIAWRLVEVNGRSAALPAGQKQPSLLLDAANKRSSGFAGCNSFFGGYTLAGSSLTFGHVGSTRMACPDHETEVETAFFEALSRTREWKIKDNTLLLMAGGTVLARLVPAAAEESGFDPGSMTYRLRSVQAGPVTLARGEFRAPAAPGSAAGITVRLIDAQAFGMAQGKEAGIVVLVVSPGGSGTFYEVALLCRGEQGWSNTDTVLLGDRVKVRSVSIRNDHVIVNMTDHGPGDPLCCPAHDATKRFAIRNDRLVPVAEQAE